MLTFTHKACITILKLLLLLELCGFTKAFGQCALTPISLDQRVGSSQLIAEGWISDLKVAHREEYNLLCTYGKLQITTYLKGREQSHQVWIETLGGQTELLIHRVSPHIDLHEGLEGLFFLEPTGYSIEGISVYRPVAYNQGILLFTNQEVIAPFERYDSIDALYNSLQSNYKLKPFYISRLPSQANPIKQDLSDLLSGPVISSISPSVTTAGTGSIISIFGNNFGRAPGALGRVNFANADNGGQSFISASSSDIRFWSETLIQVVVPSRAGTGRIQVINSQGQAAVSNFVLTITYAVLNYNNLFTGQSSPANLIDQDRNGGITFRLSTTFSQNQLAVAALRRAFESWRCGTGVNFSIADQLAVETCSADDGVNLINFDSQCRLSAGVLAATFTRITGCFSGNTLTWQVKDIDIIFSNAFNWNFGPAPTIGGRIDFETVALHELGHAHQLGHIVAPGRVMHFAVGFNQDTRVLDLASDINGGLAVIQRSENGQVCGSPPMRRLQSWQCRLNRTEGSLPVPNFSADRIRGCAPLVVRFWDLSSNNPTAWEWDIDNDGIPDYFIANPVHTYTAPGTYSVRLTVRNSVGSASTVRWFLIQVDAGGFIAVNPVSVSVCQGNVVSLTATGAQSYSWLPAHNSSATNSVYTFVPAATQTYTVNGTFANGCTSSATVQVFVRPLPELQLVSTPASGPQVGDGIIVASATQGQPPYLFRLNTFPFNSQNVFTNLFPGNYSVTVRDANGCERQLTTQLSFRSIAECSSPTNLSVTSITSTSAVLSWSAVPTASVYRLFFRRNSDPIFQQVVVSSTSHVLSGLQPATSYEWYMQTVCADRVAQPSITSVFTTTQPEPTRCLPPTINITEVASTSLRVNWGIQPNVSFWQVYFRPVQAAAWNVATSYAPATSVVLTGLVPATRYEIYVRSDCGTIGVSSFAGPFFANTLDRADQVCSQPNTWQVVSFTTGAMVNWSAVPNATGYRLTWREVSSLNSVTAFTSASVLSYTIYNLIPGRTYEISLTAICGSLTSTARTTLVTTPASSQFPGQVSQDDQCFRVYPNPGRGRFFVDLPDSWRNESWRLIIWNLNGQVVGSYEFEPAYDLNNEAELDFGLLAPGVYLIEYRSANLRKVIKWVGI